MSRLVHPLRFPPPPRLAAAFAFPPPPPLPPATLERLRAAAGATLAALAVALTPHAAAAAAATALAAPAQPTTHAAPAPASATPSTQRNPPAAVALAARARPRPRARRARVQASHPVVVFDRDFTAPLESLWPPRPDVAPPERPASPDGALPPGESAPSPTARVAPSHTLTPAPAPAPVPAPASPPPPPPPPPPPTPAPAARAPRADAEPERRRKLELPPSPSTSSEVRVLSRLFVALVVGGVIGMERRAANSLAGVRTFSLVSLGAAIFMSTTLLAFPRADPTRVAAAISSSVGFLGAGAMQKNATHSRGLTTASSVWLAAALGIAAASGMYLLSFSGAILTVMIARYARFDSSLQLIRGDPLQESQALAAANAQALAAAAASAAIVSKPPPAPAPAPAPSVVQQAPPKARAQATEADERTVDFVRVAEKETKGGGESAGHEQAKSDDG